MFQTNDVLTEAFLFTKMLENVFLCHINTQINTKYRKQRCYTDVLHAVRVGVEFKFLANVPYTEGLCRLDCTQVKSALFPLYLTSTNAGRNTK